MKFVIRKQIDGTFAQDDMSRIWYWLRIVQKMVVPVQSEPKLFMLVFPAVIIRPVVKYVIFGIAIKVIFRKSDVAHFPSMIFDMKRIEYPSPENSVIKNGLGNPPCSVKVIRFLQWDDNVVFLQ